MSGKTVVLLIALGAWTPSAIAQDTTLDVAALVTLHEAGVPSDELTRLIERYGMPSDLDATGIDRLKGVSFPKALLITLEAEVLRRNPAKLGTGDIAALVASGVSADDIVAGIRKTDSHFELTIDDLVELARQRVPAIVIKEMRARGKAAAAIQKAATTVTVEDVVDMATTGVLADEIIRRIRKVDARFGVEVDDLLDLTRQGVPQIVLKEIWKRKIGTDTVKTASGDENPTTTAPDAVPQKPDTPRSSAPKLLTHREPSGGFSIVVPEAFALYREGRNANSLVSFTQPGQEADAGRADAELQILRYRSRRPEWLVEENLDAISQRFLTMLKANYVKRGLSLTHTEGEATHASGRPARTYRVGSSAQDGSSHEGKLLVTWKDDQVFVLSYAVRSDLANTTGQLMDHCIKSFTFEMRKPVKIEEGQDVLTGLFETWRDAVTHRDFALYRELFSPDFDTSANRNAFVALSERLADPKLRLTLGAVGQDENSATVECKIIGPSSIETLKLAFNKDGERFRLTGI